MSKAWATGSTRAWRKLRSEVLFRDGGLCQLQLEDCEVYADQVHHLDGVTLAKLPSPDRLVSACGECNRKVGDPTKTDPAPEPNTDW